MASRLIVRLELTAPAKKALESLTDKHGMTQTALFSRLVEWVAHQPSTVHAAVLGQVPAAINLETAKQIFQPVAGKK